MYIFLPEFFVELSQVATNLHQMRRKSHKVRDLLCFTDAMQQYISLYLPAECLGSSRKR